MNRVLLNNAGRNHIKVFPLKHKDDLPLTEQERLAWAQQTYENLVTDKAAINHVIYSNKKKGYLITVYESQTKFYLGFCVRSNKGFYNTTIYINDNLSDLLAIAKFFKQNVEEISKSFKNSIIDIEKVVEEIANDARRDTEPGKDK